jgi:2-polyprenyl-3-methyl-5-hydroxy-6-metoxy-1,4-benzoquinol methylase
MSKKVNTVVEHYDAVAENYSQQYDKERLYTLPKYPANYFRLQRLITSFANYGIKRVVEIGVGEGTPLATLAKAGIDVWGVDISPNMVEKSKQMAKKVGIDVDHILLADIQDPVTYAPILKEGQFDGLMAMGVMPHVQNDQMVIENMASLIRPGGRVFIEFRNKMFSLFTFNRYTHEFIINDLLTSVSDDVKSKISDELKKHLKMDQPVSRDKVEGDKAGYDAILSKFHNPFEIENVFVKAGFADFKLHWYHYHPAPPYMESLFKEEFRKEAVALEHEHSGWKGIFLCSAFIVEARKSD